MNSGKNRQVLTSYLKLINEHDVQRALLYLAEDFRLEFMNGPTVDKTDLVNALGWDSGTQGNIEWNITSEDANTIAIEGRETNEFLSLLRIEPLVFQSQFNFTVDNFIFRQLHTVDWAGVSVTESLAPVIEWARRHAPNDLEIAYPGGKMVYSEDAGRNWVRLLLRWRDAVR